MSNNSQGFTKICSHCGEQRPLTAFLQLSGTEGAIYGSVCAICRKAYIEKMNLKREPDEATTSQTGFKIDSKAKVQAEKDKRELRKEREERDFDEREKKAEHKSHQKESKNKITADDKKRRELESLKKSSMFDRHKNQPDVTVFGGEAHKQKEGKIDFAAGPVEYTRVSGTIKSTSSVFQTFKTWLGNAPIVSATERAMKAQQEKNKTAPKEPHPEHSNTPGTSKRGK